MKPHNSDYWLFPKISDWDEFVEHVNFICALILSAIQEENNDTIFISVDEKTGIQALDRSASSPMKVGKNQRQEFEYVRHGTTCLIAGINIANGKILHHRIHPRDSSFNCVFV